MTELSDLRLLDYRCRLPLRGMVIFLRQLAFNKLNNFSSNMHRQNIQLIVRLEVIKGGLDLWQRTDLILKPLWEREPEAASVMY